MTKSSDRKTTQISLQELEQLLNVNPLANGAEKFVAGFATLREARAGDLTFFSDPRYRGNLAATRASVVLVPVGWTELPPNVTGIEVENPSAAFEKVVDAYGFKPTPAKRGIHPSAVIEADVEIDASCVSVGANAVIDEGAQLGVDVEIGAGCYVGKNVRIGSGSKLFANVTVLDGCVLGKNVILHSGAIIGADGFGYEFVDGQHRKVRQSGNVQIDDNVEIGANTTVDRARFGRTWIGSGTKIDNQVQIAHNAVIGRHCNVVAGVGIAGSAQIGDGVVIAAQAGIGGHVTVGSRNTIAGRSGVTKDLPDGPAEYMGFPAAPAGEERRRVAASRRLPELLVRVRKLEEAEKARLRKEG